MIGIVVGLVAEGRIARTLPGNIEVAIGGGTSDGARRAAERLLERGATALVSFGLAAGLMPGLAAGTILVPGRVIAERSEFRTDPALCAALGGQTPHDMLHSERVVPGVEQKRLLFEAHGCAALDMESGAVARAALADAKPFAVLRAICDPAERALPPAALIALEPGGGIAVGRVGGSLLRRPSQFGALWLLARDARAARAALLLRVRAITTLTPR